MIVIVPNPTTCNDTGEPVTLTARQDGNQVVLGCPACGESWTETLRIPGWRIA